MQPIKIDIDAMARCDEAGEWAATSSKYDNISDMLADGVDIDDIPESYYSFYASYYVEFFSDYDFHRLDEDEDDEYTFYDDYTDNDKNVDNALAKTLAKTQPNLPSKNCPFAHFRKGRGIKALRGKVSDNSDNLSEDGQLQGRLLAVFEIARSHPWKLVQSGLMIFP